MSNRRPISWSAALCDIRADRAVRLDIREDGAFTLMRAWRGKSGKRYVVQAKGREEVPANAVVIAVARPAGAAAQIVAVASFDAQGNGFPLFRSIAHAGGATELVMHRLAETTAARAAVVADLAPGARVDAAQIAAAPLASSSGYDRAAIMAAAIAIVRARQNATGEAWSACIGPALKAAWAVAKLARAGVVH